MTKIIFHHSNTALIFHVFFFASFISTILPSFLFHFISFCMQQSLCRSICTHTGMRIYERTHARCTHTLPYVFMSLFGKRVTQTQRNVASRTHTRTHAVPNASTWLQMPVLFFTVALKSKVNLTHRISARPSSVSTH